MANPAMAAYDSNDEDTDSLEIKPPQMIGRYDKHKKSSGSIARNEKKHSRGEHRHKERARDRSDRHGGRQHHGTQSSGRHHATGPTEPYSDKYHNSSSRDSSSHHKRRKRYSPEKTDGERELEDLRSRLLSKRSKQDIERKIEEHQMYHRNGEADRNRSEKDHYQQYNKHHSKKSVIEVIDSPEDYTEIDNDKYKSDKYKEKIPEDPETIKRRAKFLEADREMAKRKVLAREELEARRELRREKGTSSVSPHSHKQSSRHKSQRHHHRTSNADERSVIQLSESENDDDKSSDSARDDDDDENDTDTGSDSGTNTKSNYSRSDEHSDCDVPTSPLSVGDLSKSDHRRRHSRSHSRSGSRSKSPSTSRSRSRSRSRRCRSTRSRSTSRRGSRSPRRRRNSSSDRDIEKRSPPYSRKRNRKHSSESEIDDVDMKSESESKSETKPTDGDRKDCAPKPVEDELPAYYPGLQGCRSVEEFKCLNRIAEGTYGIVFRAQDKRTEEIVALKRLKMEKEKDGFPITSLREINTLLKGQHPNIVTVREIVVGSNMDKIFIVMDYVEHDFKTLMETMTHRKQSFLPAEVKCLTQQLLRAVAHLHDNWILHRDLKTSNLLLSHKGVLKVGDFGLAREYGSPLKQYTSVVVTLWYRAPELLLCCKEYSTPIDMWSVGCIFAEFLSMAPLFPGQSETDQLNKIFKFLGTPNETIWPGYSQLPAVQKIKFAEYPVSNVREKFGRRTSDLGIQLLQGLLTYDPKQRLTAEQALRNPYFKELPLPIDPAMLPTWPAKSELGARKALAASPKPPSGGGQYKKLQSDADESRGFILGAALDAHARQVAMGPGFNLKF